MPPCLYSRQVRNYGLGVLRGTCKEYVDCLYSRQVRNQNGLGVHRGACKRVCGLPLLQTSQKLWYGCPPRHLQQSMQTASTPDKSEIRMAWVSTAAPATEHADCLCSSPF